MEDTKSSENAERIGVIGSPSSTAELNIDILGTAVDKRLVGALAFFDYTQEGNTHYALGQITEITLRNIWSEDPTMRGLIRQRGRVDTITEKQDTHAAKMAVSSVFQSENGRVSPSILGTIPSTGTHVKILDQAVMDSILSDYKRELFFLGHTYGSAVRMPLWFRHFGSKNGGLGEAYHIGAFGKTGSGKSWLTKMIIAGYARHRLMSIFILDPQGEFTEDLRSSSHLGTLLTEKLGRAVECYDLHNMVLTGDDLFARLLPESSFMSKLPIFHEDNKIRAAQFIRSVLEVESEEDDRRQLKPWTLSAREKFDLLWARMQNEDDLGMIYTSEEPRRRLLNAIQRESADVMYSHWRRFANLFSYRGRSSEDSAKIKDLVKRIAADDEGVIVSVDLSESRIPDDIFWNDSIKMVVIGEIVRRLNKEAETKYKSGKSMNCLVVMDEAHRLAPKERPENINFQQVKRSLIDAVRTTRKYGLGWLFISQTLFSLDKDILSQIRVFFFGFGMGWGNELNALKEIVGGNREAIRLYQRFTDPQSALDKRDYPFMTYGPISPLSFSGTPLFFNALEYPDEFLSVNFGDVNGN